MQMLIAMMALMWVGGAGLAGPDPWRIPPSSSVGGVANQVIAAVTFDSEHEDCRAPQGSEMYQRVHGYAAVLDGKTFRQLAASARLKQPDVGPNQSELVPLYRVGQCVGAESKATVVRLSQSANGSVWAMGEGEDASRVPQLLESSKVQGILNDWPSYAGEFDERTGGHGLVKVLSKPYWSSRHVLDKPTLGDRFLRGRAVTIDSADRLLALESMYMRLPREYDAKSPAGLLVWIDSSDKGEPPECLFEVCDSSNIVIVGIANCGNIRPIANRYQLGLDAVATVSRRTHIDKRRIYTSGLSGGARVASVLASCFPDVYAGAIPIVGLSCYEAVAVPGRGRYAPAFAKPQESMLSLLRKRRIGVITGGKDFNQPEIIGAAQVMRGDGLQVRTFERVELGHELPTPEHFAQAMVWVDEPYQAVRKAEIAQAQRLLKSAMAKIGGREVLTDADRSALMRVTEAGPWSSEAWKAIELLDRSAIDSAPR